MRLDGKQQQEILLAAINAASWQGTVVELVAAVKQAVQSAEIVGPSGVPVQEASE